MSAITSQLYMSVAKKTYRPKNFLFLFICSRHREFFGQGWMKNDKNEKTPYIMRTTKHFNDVCSNQQTPYTTHFLQLLLIAKHNIECKPLVSLFPLQDKQPYCHRDPALWGCGDSSSGHREMGGCGRHLSLSPQLQRGARDHLFPQPQLCLPPQEDLAQGFQAGVFLPMYCLPSIFFLMCLVLSVIVFLDNLFF